MFKKPEPKVGAISISPPYWPFCQVPYSSWINTPGPTTKTSSGRRWSMGGSLPDLTRSARKGGSRNPRADLAPADGAAAAVAAPDPAAAGVPAPAVGATLEGVLVQDASTTLTTPLAETAKNSLRVIFLVAI